MTDRPEPDFKAIHKQAADICLNNPLLAYSIAKEVRKRVVGKESEGVKHELLSQLAFSSWNELVGLQQSRDPNSVKAMLELVAETLIFAFDILTEKITYAQVPSRPHK